MRHSAVLKVVGQESCCGLGGRGAEHCQRRHGGGRCPIKDQDPDPVLVGGPLNLADHLAVRPNRGAENPNVRWNLARDQAGDLGEDLISRDRARVELAFEGHVGAGAAVFATLDPRARQSEGPASDVRADRRQEAFKAGGPGGIKFMQRRLEIGERRRVATEHGGKPQIKLVHVAPNQ